MRMGRDVDGKRERLWLRIYILLGSGKLELDRHGGICICRNSQKIISNLSARTTKNERFFPNPRNSIIFGHFSRFSNARKFAPTLTDFND